MHLLIQLRLIILLLSAPVETDFSQPIPLDFDEWTVCADGLSAGKGDVLAFWHAPRILPKQGRNEHLARATDLYSIRPESYPIRACTLPSQRDILHLKRQLNI